jgi:hypothetical protein
LTAAIAHAAAAPVAATSAARAGVMPPMATTGTSPAPRTAAPSPAVPWTGSGLSLVDVE